MDRALSEEAMRAALHGLRVTVPEGGWLTEMLTGAGAGLLLAALLAGLLRRVTTDVPGAALPPKDDLADRLALARRLKATDPATFAEIAPNPYSRDGLPSVNILQRAMRR